MPDLVGPFRVNVNDPRCTSARKQRRISPTNHVSFRRCEMEAVMRTAVLMLCALCSASLLAQGPRGGGVAAGTRVAIVKDGLQSSEGPILMPDGTTLFTEPGASKVHKIDKNGTKCCTRRLPSRCSPRCRRGRSSGSARHPALAGREDVVLRRLRRRVPHCVRRAGRRESSRVCRCSARRARRSD